MVHELLARIEDTYGGASWLRVVVKGTSGLRVAAKGTSGTRAEWHNGKHQRSAEETEWKRLEKSTRVTAG